MGITIQPLQRSTYTFFGFVLIDDHTLFVCSTTTTCSWVTCGQAGVVPTTQARFARLVSGVSCVGQLTTFTFAAGQGSCGSTLALCTGGVVGAHIPFGFGWVVTPTSLTRLTGLFTFVDTGSGRGIAEADTLTQEA